MMNRRKLAAFAGVEDKMPPDALPVPRIEQKTDFSCGAAALLAVLTFFDEAESSDERDLHAELGTNQDEGTGPEKIVEAANRRGLTANWRTGIDVEDLRDAIGDGVPVILDLQEWDERPSDPENHTEDGHYVVLIAIEEEQAWVMNPSGGEYEAISVDDLKERWRDVEGERGGVFVMPPRRTLTKNRSSV